MDLAYTRAMVDASLNDAFGGVPFREDPVFGLSVPTMVPGVPDEILDPRATWSDKAGYDEQASTLAGMFVANFAKYADLTSAKVRGAGPRISSS
jgi:phosphoenolpyruvate carboxykinase (ATP)